MGFNICYNIEHTKIIIIKIQKKRYGKNKPRN